MGMMAVELEIDQIPRKAVIRRSIATRIFLIVIVGVILVLWWFAAAEFGTWDVRCYFSSCSFPIPLSISNIEVRKRYGKEGMALAAEGVEMAKAQLIERGISHLLFVTKQRHPNANPFELQRLMFEQIRRKAATIVQACTSGVWSQIPLQCLGDGALIESVSVYETHYRAINEAP